jgi:hypothetical protein
MALDISLNIYSMHQELTDAWLQNQENRIHMLLCDCYSNILLEVRKIDIDPYIAKYIREKLKQQKKHYANAIEVQKQIEHIMDTTPTDTMMKKITMHKVP